MTIFGWNCYPDFDRGVYCTETGKKALGMFGQFRIATDAGPGTRRLTIGLRRIFDPLASLAGLALSAFGVRRDRVEGVGIFGR